MRVLIALGGNLDDPLRHVVRAIRCLSGVVQVSGVYETEPIGGPPGQPDYVNAVAELAWLGSPWRLLDRLQALEEEAGRRRSVPNAARPLDLDIVWIDGLAIASERLVVPHPRAGERRFVLEPLAELDPGLARHLAGAVLPGRVRRVGELAFLGD